MFTVGASSSNGVFVGAGVGVAAGAGVLEGFGVAEACGAGEGKAASCVTAAAVGSPLLSVPETKNTAAAASPKQTIILIHFMKNAPNHSALFDFFIISDSK